LPFKSSLFSIAEQEINMYNGTGTHELFIQPAVISYTAIGSLPIDSTQWPMIAWYGDMDLVPHLWQLLKFPRIDAKLTLLPPVTLAEMGNRKKLAHYLRERTLEVLQSR
jgi:1-acyl-sn-glycerol-3-phosphate acyltransferase